MFEVLDSKKVGDKARVVALRQKQEGNLEDFTKVEVDVKLGDRSMATTE